MADDIRLYMLESGTLKCHVENIKMNTGLGEPYEIPVPWYLLVHPKGNVIIDGGNAAACATDARAHWGGICDVYWPTMKPSDAVIPQLEQLDIDPATVKWVCQSHLHLDHTGALASLEELPNASVLVDREELAYAHAPDWFAAGGYIQADFNKPGVPWVPLEAHEDGYDVFGDGVLRAWKTPGHASGHLSYEVTLPQSGTILLTVDAAYTTEHWDEKVLPGFLASAVDTVRSVRKLHRIAERSGATVVTGHDPDAWPQFKQAPEHYS